MSGRGRSPGGGGGGGGGRGKGSAVGRGAAAVAVGAVVALGAFGVSYLIDKIGELDRMASPKKMTKGSRGGRREVSASGPAMATTGTGGRPPHPPATTAATPASTMPSAARSAALRRQWMSDTDHNDFKEVALTETYNRLRGEPLPDTALADVIDRDIERTFPKSPLFQQAATKDALRRVLRAYALHDPDVGYVQGLNFLVGFMFHHLDTEAEVFVLLVRLLQHPKYNMRAFFVTGLPEVGVVGHMVKALIALHLPSVAAHFAEVGCEPAFFFEWYFTMFTYTLPLDMVADVWTEFFSEGWAAVFRIMIVLLENAEPYMRDQDLHGTIGVLKAYHAHRLVSDFPELRDNEDAAELLTSPAPAPAAAAGTPTKLKTAFPVTEAVIKGTTQLAWGAWTEVGSWLGYPTKEGSGSGAGSGAGAEAGAGAGSRHGTSDGASVSPFGGGLLLQPPVDLVKRSRSVPLTTERVEELRAVAQARVQVEAEEAKEALAARRAAREAASTPTSSPVPAPTTPTAAEEEPQEDDPDLVVVSHADTIPDTPIPPQQP